MRDSSWARFPDSVQKWDNFIQNANGMAVDDTTPQFDTPTFRTDMEVSNEETVRYALSRNVFEVLSEIGDRQPTKEKFDLCLWTALGQVKGNPDYVLFAGSNLIIPIEVKTTWNLPVDNMVEIPDVDDPLDCVASSIMQIFGYMAQNKRQYGVLSTYDKTWFLWRPESDSSVLLISDVVRTEDTSPTLLRCFAYIMSLARQDSDCPFPPPSPPQSLEDHHVSPEENDDDSEDKDPTYQPPASSRSGKGGHDSGKCSAGKMGNTSKRNRPSPKGKRAAVGNHQLDGGELRVEKFDWDSFELTDELGGGRCGRVFEGSLRGERVAVKLTDLWQHPELHEEMLREARVYVELGKLQGDGIPRLKGVGYTAGGLFALMTEFGGYPIEVENLNDVTREMIVGVLANIHGEGFLHGDLKCANILVEHYHDGPRIMFIDFGFARRFWSRKESVREMAELNEIIRFPK
jgi:serine/threonine protein kinase